MARQNSSHSQSYTVVIKLGTSSIVHEETHQPLLSTLSSVVETVVKLRQDGHRVVLVSSGAIGIGLKRMNMAQRSKSLSGKQALAAIGQGRLIALYDNLFGQVDQPIAQILLTRGDISDRTRYLNAVNTLNELLLMGVLPIVNENDTISVSEIKFGDNDTLSAVTSSMIHADFLVLLTDVDGLYTANPRKDPTAKQVEVVESVAAIRSQVSTNTLGSSLGTGGMETKLIAADIATAAGVTTIITSSKNPMNIVDIINYHRASRRSARSGIATPLESPNPDEGVMTSAAAPTLASSSSATLNAASSLPHRPPHTVFLPSASPIRDLKAWTRHTLFPAGSVVVDHGAHRVLSRRESGGRLLPAGVLGVIGKFASGQAVRIVVPKVVEGASQGAAGGGAPNPMVSGLAKAVGVVEELQQEASAPGSSASTRPGTPDGAAHPEPSKMPTREYTEDDVIEVGRGLANYNWEQVLRVKGLNSSQMPQVLVYVDSEYVVENITIRVPPST
ncbi:glutamate 5-kinase [Schizophyllum commune H4-8]|uniref:Aspartate/glutamate/uridylate kinase domain-containing protein n=1 Tax=Schizophyllum commune (strain H4-8 / FGSC 9210) TaxID=578458 RepID=D8PU53_SCHCM|nr:glutamate 5-kinase [Schizophyllum commune H4-8]KAI5899147.1 glutamate 5-kinase [Schizophyllum commune H4-8]